MCFFHLKNSSTISIARDITLVISTYNNPLFLELVLKTVASQRTFPLEVIIADDGSTAETRELIDSYREIIPVPLIHSWIPDQGYRLAKSRNVAIAKAKGEYIISIDGDMLLTPYFIEDHRRLMKKGQFVAGSRARLKEKATRKRGETKHVDVHIWSPGLIRRLVLLRFPGMHHLIKGHSGLKKARGCHLAFWKNDFILVNGFEENFEGWGFEDSEFVQRLLNNGLKRKNAKLLAPAVHLYHKEKSASQATENRLILEHTLASGKKKAEKGVDQYLD